MPDTTVPHHYHYLDHCPCGTDHRLEAREAQARGEVVRDGNGDEVHVPARTSVPERQEQPFDRRTATELTEWRDHVHQLLGAWKAGPTEAQYDDDSGVPELHLRIGPYRVRTVISELRKDFVGPLWPEPQAQSGSLQDDQERRLLKGWVHRLSSVVGARVPTHTLDLSALPLETVKTLRKILKAAHERLEGDTARCESLQSALAQAQQARGGA